MNYRNLALLVVALVLTAGAGGIWLAYANSNQAKPTTEDVPVTPTPVAPPATSGSNATESDNVLVGFDTETMMLGLNESMDVNVKLDSSGAEVQTLALAVGFDPAVIRVNSVSGTGSFDLYLGNKVDTVRGYAQISGAAVGGKSVSNDASFAKLNITRIASGESKLTIAAPSGDNPYTQVILLGSEQSYSVPEKSITIN